MHIAFFLAQFPSVSETFILHQITGLIDLGHEVDIYAERPPENGGPVHHEVKTYRLLERTTYLTERMPLATGYWAMPVWPITGQTWLPGAEKPIPNTLRVLQALPTFFRCLAKSPRLTRQVLDRREYGEQAACLATLYNLRTLGSQSRRYDILHAHFGPVGNNFRFVRTLWKAPWVVSFHGYDFSVVPREEGTNIFDSLFQLADAVTVNSQVTRQRLIDLGSPPDRTHVLHYGVDLNQFSVNRPRRRVDEPMRILSVARLVEKKGIEFAIRAVAQISRKFPGTRYEIIGEGPLRSSLEKLAKQLGVIDNVIFQGAQDSQFIQQRMSDAHVFVLTSVTATSGDQEGTPVSLMEAQAAGLPVLSTLHSGIPEVVRQNQSGFLLSERDVPALVEKLLYLIGHPEVCAQMGQQGREHINNEFDIHKCNQALVAIYEKAITQYETIPA